jgi:hypothetical protein
LVGVLVLGRGAGLVLEKNRRARRTGGRIVFLLTSFVSCSRNQRLSRVVIGVLGLGPVACLGNTGGPGDQEEELYFS